jgi:hypothetical protein
LHQPETGVNCGELCHTCRGSFTTRGYLRPVDSKGRIAEPCHHCHPHTAMMHTSCNRWCSALQQQQQDRLRDQVLTRHNALQTAVPRLPDVHCSCLKHRNQEFPSMDTLVHFALRTKQGLPAACRFKSSCISLPQLTARPEPMCPVDRLSHRFSVTPVSSQRQSAGLGLILRPLSSWGRFSAYLPAAAAA